MVDQLDSGWEYKPSTRMWKKRLSAGYKLNVKEMPRTRQWGWSLLHKETSRKPHRIVAEGEALSLEEAQQQAEECVAELMRKNWKW